jgi:hypothetical protein
MTVIFSGHEDWRCPEPPVRCSCCGSRTMPPFVFWRWACSEAFLLYPLQPLGSPRFGKRHDSCSGDS